MSRIDFYGHVRQYLVLKSEIDKVITDVIANDVHLCPKARMLEGRLSRLTSMKHIKVTDSRIDAPVLALRMMGIRPGDEVITTANPFYTTVDAIRLIGAEPVLVDCDSDTWTMSPGEIEEKITSRTKAIMPVHTYGHVADMPAITEIAKKHDLFVVEEFGESIDAEAEIFRTGELSDAICWCTNTPANVGPSGDAGVAATNRADIAVCMLDVRDGGSAKYLFDARNPLQIMQAMVHRIQIKHFQEWKERRIELAEEYTSLLSDTGIRLPCVKSGCRHAFGMYVIETPGRDDLQRFLKERGIATMTKRPEDVVLCKQLGLHESVIAPGLQESRKHAERCLALPIYPELTSEEVKYIAGAIKEWVKTGPADRN